MDKDFAENPTEAEAPRFQNEISEFEVRELQQLEDCV
jgi:hypothetical protein